MAKKEIYVLTDNFPYGIGEAFLNSEAVFLSKYFETVHYVPLWKNGEKRDLPEGSVVEWPLLNFRPKGNVKLVLKGLFCFSPLFFAVPIFFKEKVWKGRKRFWDFMTSFLVIRAAYSSLRLKFNEGDLVYSYWGDRLALLLPLLKKRFGVVTVARFHGTDLYEEANKGYKPFRKWLYHALDLAVPISENGRQYLMERYRADAPKRIEVHRLGVFNHGLNPKEEESEFQIVSCSNVVPVKRVALLAKAIGNLGINVRWTHIGDGPLRSEVEAVIEKFPENVKGVMLGAMPNAEVLRYYTEHHVDLFVNVSKSEGVPVSIMEAFSFGIPVMATNVGGVSEIVDYTVGKLLPVDVTVEQLRKDIEEFYNSPDAVSMRSRARQRWKERSDAERNYVCFCDLLLGLTK
ncbi:MAG: glycosyltransferase [Bacteroidales bacterium]|nr:glycosyltransferase [Bacteroidales bacterium]